MCICRYIENEYLGLRNGILDQSAILLSSQGCLTFMNCKVIYEFYYSYKCLILYIRNNRWFKFSAELDSISVMIFSWFVLHATNCVLWRFLGAYCFLCLFCYLIQFLLWMSFIHSSFSLFMPPLGGGGGVSFLYFCCAELNLEIQYHNHVLAQWSLCYCYLINLMATLFMRFALLLNHLECSWDGNVLRIKPNCLYQH